MVKPHTRAIGSGIIAIMIAASLVLSFSTARANPHRGLSSQTGSQELTAGQGSIAPQRTSALLSSAPPVPPDIQLQRLEAMQARPNRSGPPLLLNPALATLVPQPDVPKTSAVPATGLNTQRGSIAQAPNDFAFFRSTDIRASANIPSGGRSQVGEPSADVRGDAIFMTGNWYAAFSTDRGQFFQYIDPFASFPADDGGFCCDQVVIYDASRDLMFWLLQYINDGTDNRQRLAVIRGSDLVPGMSGASWYYYDFSPASFGITGDRELDYPKLALSNNFLYINTNVFDISDDTFTNYAAWRIPLDELAAAGTVNFQFFTGDDVGSLMPTDGATSTMYWGAHTSLSEVRIYRWDETSGQIFWDDVAIAAWGDTTHHCQTPDGNDPCAFGDGRMLGGWVANGVIGFMWNSSQHDNFPFPYVDVARFNQTDRTLIDQPLLWHDAYAWLYPAVSVNRRGHIAGPVFIAGGDVYPQMNVFIADDISGAPAPWENYYVQSSTDGPARNRWGDYAASRRHEQHPSTWTSAGFTLQGGSNNDSMRPQWVWFGRLRDSPPSVPDNDDFTNARVLAPSISADVILNEVSLITVSQDTTQATAAVDDPITACGAPNSRQSRSVWYRLVPPRTGSYTISTAASSYDTVVALWTGARGALTSGGCDDDGGAAKASSLTRTLNGGSTYYVEVLHYGAGSGGLLNLNISFEPRVTDGLQALYTFEEAGGTVVNDVSGVGAPLDLYVGDPAAARWVAGGLVISRTTTLASESVATKVIAAARATDEISIEAWIKPTNARQNRLARILTLSNDYSRRNVELLQEPRDSGRPVRYSVRLRTTGRSSSGDPRLQAPERPLGAQVQHVVFTRDATGVARIYVDGVMQVQATIGGDFLTWDSSYHLVLGNTLTGDRPWLGEYQLVALYNRALNPAEVSQNFHAGPSGDSLLGDHGSSSR